ncbi:caspase domain-containing protein [Mycena pura]|uniref:Caspase domain-containing protein n=1 Tax=Mycena pura TaxID=153505 RepID=A0AAD6YF02_9AGAR|nr:caspase domain-containing protein [Mycena pura]
MPCVPRATRRVSILAPPPDASLAPPDLSSIPLTCAGRKHALLIGIGACDGYPALRGAHGDVRKMRALLLDVYGYTPDVITVLLDDGVPGHTQPTRANILAAIADLVRDVQAGDHLVFHYCGHSMQVENRTNSEEDGMDECLLPLDGEENKIVDNVRASPSPPSTTADDAPSQQTQELHEALVKPLPAGAHLVAVLDTCHSGSLLDLKHYRCNRVPVPWMWRGKRDSEEIRSQIASVRRDARFVTVSQSVEVAPLPPIAGEPAPARASIARRCSVISVQCESPSASPAPSRAPSGAAPALSPLAGGATARGRLARIRGRRSRTASLPGAPAPEPAPPGKENQSQRARPSLALKNMPWILPEEEAVRCDSPVAQFPCTGWCRERVGRGYGYGNDCAAAVVAEEVEEDRVKADVISLASCKDSQQAWEADGKSMTSSLVDMLRENPNRTLKDVLVNISFAAYSMAQTRHAAAKKFKRERKSYIAYLRELLARLERRKEARTPDAPPAPRPAANAPRTGRARALSTPVRSLTDQIAKVVKAKEKWEAVASDMDSVQNPELASPRPLDMNRIWRM